MPGSGQSELDNQSPPYVDVDLFRSDVPLRAAVTANGAGAKASLDALSAFGRHWGSADMFAQAKRANDNPPKLDNEIVIYDAAYDHFMAESIGAGLHAMTWKTDATPAPQPAEVARAARFYMVAQVENGHMCPITMTRAAVGALAAEPALVTQLMPKIMAHVYDARFQPWWDKAGITIGMGMTEKQGGTDVRANTTRATPVGEGYTITGHKWFMSAPMCDAFLVLAQAPAGLTCFFMPRFRPDGQLNGLHFVRLKDKLGNRSNASSEVEFEDAYALRVGEEGRGIRTILQMVQLTRLDCAISSAGMMRMALAQALHHARYRTVFQKKLVDQPMMRSVLADLALEVEGAVALVMRLCRSFDLAPSDPLEAARARLLTPVVKYAVCKTAPAFVYEAMECLGGNGYVEDSVLPRLYREAPVNAIWEGSGNVMALDLLRAVGRAEEANAVIAALAREAHGLPGTESATRQIAESMHAPDAEAHARIGVERFARLAAIAALAGSAPDVAPIYARARLDERRGATFGAAVLGGAIPHLLDRALPQ
ncbi:MAG: acyl-CoA dehydrogenase family protein [Rhizobiales bacterium]|nr:acyl-CoA dehydrogenase family protein [Hyphomicrobiales bacterium]